MFRISCFRHGCSNSLSGINEASVVSSWCIFKQLLFIAMTIWLHLFQQEQFEGEEKNEHVCIVALTWVFQADNAFNMPVITLFATNCNMIADRAEAHIACCFDKLTGRLMLICIVEDCCDQLNQRVGAEVQQLLSYLQHCIQNAGSMWHTFEKQRSWTA